MLDQLTNLARTAAWLLPPGRGKNRVLRLLGHDVDPTARIGICLFRGPTAVRVGAGTVIGSGNTFRGLRVLDVGEDVIIGQFNWISTAPTLRDVGDGDHGALRLGDHAVLTNRHYVDVSGGVVLAPFATIGGVRSTVLSHSVDLETGRQTTVAVRLAGDAFVSTNCVVMAGTRLTERAVLAAGSVTALNREYEPNTLFGGVPAKAIRAIDGAYFHRTRAWIGR